tara:strand:- start:744 stop:1094 length:351 start_codon:yes stop_codon:yes gene_type:complete
MNHNLEKVTQSLKPLLLSNLEIRTDKKLLKRGQLKLFQIKQYNVFLTLEYEGKTKNLELPYPFRIEPREDSLVFNYELSAFIPDKNAIFVKCMDSSSKSKLYDNLLYFLITDNVTV